MTPPPSNLEEGAPSGDQEECDSFLQIQEPGPEATEVRAMLCRTGGFALDITRYILQLPLKSRWILTFAGCVCARRRCSVAYTVSARPHRRCAGPSLHCPLAPRRATTCTAYIQCALPVWTKTACIHPKRRERGSNQGAWPAFPTPTAVVLAGRLSLVTQHRVLFLAWLPYAKGVLREDGTFAQQQPLAPVLTGAAQKTQGPGGVGKPARAQEALDWASSRWWRPVRQRSVLAGPCTQSALCVPKPASIL